MRSVVTAIIAIALATGACSTGGGTFTAGPADDAWRTASLRDVVTGQEFRISDLQGKVVAIEAMAIWCSTCRIQQGEAQAALDRVASPDVVYISLDVDPNEREEELAEYAAREGFGWRFVVASPDVSRSLVATFGEQILSPPATPLVVLDPSGEVVAQRIGITLGGELLDLFEEHLP